MKFEVVRYQYYDDRTIGQLQLDGRFFCYTMEPTVRQSGIKIDGKTAIPEGTYPITIRPFRGDPLKMYPHLENVPGFDGVCLHGGNVPADTLGCILVAYNTDDQVIYGSAIKDLVQKMNQAEQPLEISVRNGG